MFLAFCNKRIFLVCSDCNFFFKRFFSLFKTWGEFKSNENSELFLLELSKKSSNSVFVF